MQYTPPFGAPPDTPYVDVDAPTGREGSPVPAAAIEHPMRELDHLIAFAGLTPSSEDLQQVRKAITGLIADALANITRAFNPGFIRGFRLANVSASPATHLSVSEGACRDLQDTRNIVMPAPLIKRLDQAWAPGDNAGGRFSGAAPRGNGTYHVQLLSNDTDPTLLDVGFADSTTGSDGPAGWTVIRRLGSPLVEPDGSWSQFLQHDDEFILRGPHLSYNATPPTVRQLVPLRVPFGIPVLARFWASWVGLPGNSFNTALLLSPHQWDQVPNDAMYNLYGNIGQEANQPLRDVQSLVSVLLTDNAARVALRASASRGFVRIITTGWVDKRGRVF